MQDVFQPIPAPISCSGVTKRWGLLSNAQMQSDDWLYSKDGRDSMKAPFLRAAVSLASVGLTQACHINVWHRKR